MGAVLKWMFPLFCEHQGCLWRPSMRSQTHTNDINHWPACNLYLNLICGVRKLDVEADVYTMGRFNWKLFLQEKIFSNVLKLSLLKPLSFYFVFHLLSCNTENSVSEWKCVSIIRIWLIVILKPYSPLKIYTIWHIFKI